MTGGHYKVSPAPGFVTAEIIYELITLGKLKYSIISLKPRMN